MAPQVYFLHMSLHTRNNWGRATSIGSHSRKTTRRLTATAWKSFLAWYPSSLDTFSIFHMTAVEISLNGLYYIQICDKGLQNPFLQLPTFSSASSEFSLTVSLTPVRFPLLKPFHLLPTLSSKVWATSDFQYQNMFQLLLLYNNLLQNLVITITSCS